MAGPPPVQVVAHVEPRRVHRVGAGCVREKAAAAAEATASGAVFEPLPGKVRENVELARAEDAAKQRAMSAAAKFPSACSCNASPMFCGIASEMPSSKACSAVSGGEAGTGEVNIWWLCGFLGPPGHFLGPHGTTCIVPFSDHRYCVYCVEISSRCKRSNIVDLRAAPARRSFPRSSRVRGAPEPDAVCRGASQ